MRKSATGSQLTERDLELLSFINSFGFCEMPQIDRRFGFRKPRNYQIINRLIGMDLVKHERVFYGRHGIYRLTRKGARWTKLPPLARVPLSNYYHDLTVTEVYLKLRQQNPDARWVSARTLMKDKHLGSVGRRGHLPDGVLVLADGQRVAIEIELTLKSRRRLEGILRGYGGAFEYKVVRYYCSEPVVAYMAPMAARWPFIEIHHLKGFLE